MNRGAAFDYLETFYAPVITDAGVDEVWLAYVVNDALRVLGTAEGDLLTADVATPQVPAYYVALDWALWKGLAARWTARVSTTSEGGLRRERQQAFDHARQMRDDAATRLTVLGYSAALAQPAAVYQRVSSRDPYGVRDGILLGQTL
jgi:hypothetical protein